MKMSRQSQTYRKTFGKNWSSWKVFKVLNFKEYGMELLSLWSKPKAREAINEAYNHLQKAGGEGIIQNYIGTG